MTKTNKEIEIVNDGELKEAWINKLNSNVAKNEEVRENLSKSGKAYLVVAGDNYIDKIYKSKRARGYVEKQQGQRYYSEASMSMVNAGAGLKIVKVTSDEFMQTDEAELFYNWLFSEYRNLRGGSLNRTRINYFVDKYGMEEDEDIKHLVSDEHLAQMERGQFDVIDRFEDTEETEQTDEAEQETTGTEEAKQTDETEEADKTEGGFKMEEIKLESDKYVVLKDEYTEDKNARYILAAKGMRGVSAEYVTWLKTETGLALGHYHPNLEAALKDFNERVAN